MAPHARFHYQVLQELREETAALGLNIPISDDLSPLASPVSIGRCTAPNRIAIHPMEGCDGNADGSPGELTIRRYERFAGGGAGLLWVEACAVVPEGRANPHQLWLTTANVESFAALVDRIHTVARERMGANFRPVTVLQLTHSGRYSKPVSQPAPLIAHHSIIDARSAVTDDTLVVTDEYLDSLQDAYLQSALLARQAGFDAVDIKACHRYLLSELLASFTRDHSRYGGSFENRTRLLREVVARIRQEVPELEVTSRLNVYDALPYPFGWGVDSEDENRANLSEPLRLIGELMTLGCHTVNVTIGNPYYQPHFNRPYDRPIQGGYLPEEHPLQGIARFIGITRTIQQAYPALAVVGTGYSWLRQFFPQVAAGAITHGVASLVGAGREAFAYPDFARDILHTGRMDPKRCCTACSGCTQMMRDGVPSGCMVRDTDIYGSIYREGRQHSLPVPP